MSLQDAMHHEMMQKNHGDRQDMMYQRCIDPFCSGIFQETSLHDDREGVLHCSHCRLPISRYWAPEPIVTPVPPLPTPTPEEQAAERYVRLMTGRDA